MARNLSSRKRGSDRFFRALGRRRRRGRPGGRGAGRAVREPGHHFTALAAVARPYLQETISEAPPTRRWRSTTSPRSARSCATTRPSSASCARAWPRCRPRPRSWPTPSRPAPTSCRKTIQTNEDLADVFEALADFSDDPLRARGDRPAHAPRRPRCGRLCTSSRRPRPSATTRRSGSATPPACSPRATRTAPGSASMYLGAHRRRAPVNGPNNEGGPSCGAGQRADAHEPPPQQPLPEHRRARADARVRGGQRALYAAGQTMIGNPPGNQGTEHQRASTRPRGGHAMRRVAHGAASRPSRWA